MNKINTAAVVGVGAIGSFFADKLDLALGESFKVIAGGERAERLKKRRSCHKRQTALFPYSFAGAEG